MISYIHTGELKRIVDFPYKVMNAGATHFYNARQVSHKYDTLEICIRLSAEGEYAMDTIDGRDFSTPFPHVVFKMPGLTHSFKVEDHRESVFFIYSEETASLIEKAGLLPQIPLQAFEKASPVSKKISELNTLLARTREFASADRLDMLCFSILEELCFMREIKTTDGNHISARILRAASYIQMNRNGELDTASLAAKYGFSERSFFRHFINYMGTTPAKYLTEVKMKLASYLLIHTNMTIREISESLNFCDDNYFSTKFKRFYSITPVEYRKRRS